ncbi:MAG: chemotaxis protein CheW [Candidatus Methylomirabilales bacterium]
MTRAAAEPTSASSAPQQFLTFALGGEEYGVEILKIQEIKGFSAITPLPNAPAYVKGVLNLRGTIVPILDLRKKFGLPDVEYTQFTVIVVVQVQGKVTGFVVDAVSDVLTVQGSDIQATPDLHGQVDTSCLTGLAKAGEKLVILLDIDRMLASGEMAAVAAAAVEPTA